MEEEKREDKRASEVANFAYVEEMVVLVVMVWWKWMNCGSSGSGGTL